MMEQFVATEIFYMILDGVKYEKYGWTLISIREIDSYNQQKSYHKIYNRLFGKKAFQNMMESTNEGDWAILIHTHMKLINEKVVNHYDYLFIIKIY